MRFKSLFGAATAALLLGTLSSAHAQETVSLKLDLVSWGDDITGLSLHSGGANQALTAKSFTYSTPVRYSGPAIMQIHQQGGAKVDPKAPPNPAPIPPELAALREKDPTIVAIAKLPSGSRRATVLIAPAQSGTYQTFVIDDDPSKLPLGKLRVHNYSPMNVAVRCNGKQGAAMKLKDSFLADPKEGQIVYELAYQQDGEWTVQENNLLSITPQEQVQLIVLKSDADFFRSGDGSRTGFLQTVTLRRTDTQP